MKTQRLAFSQLHEEMEVLGRENLRIIKGGVAASSGGTLSEWLSNQLGMTVISSTDVDGNWVVSVDGGNSWMPLVFQLDEVIIVGQGSYDRPNIFTSFADALGIGWADGNGAVYGITGGSGGSGGTGGGGTPLTQTDWYIAISTMLSTMDLSVSGASISAQLMGLQMPAGFVYTGHFLTFTSMADNVIQLTEGFNWNDASQLGVGGVLIGTGLVFSAPVSVPIIFIGGVGLFIWELAEAPYLVE